MTEEELYAKKILCELNDILDEIAKLDYKGINIFKAVGVERQEVKHSSFLAWLMSPSEKHGLGNLFLCKLVEKLFSHSNRAEDGAEPALLTNSQILSNAKIMSFDTLRNFVEADDVRVETEKVVLNKESRIDILLSSCSARTVMAIENKVFTSTHDEQLTRYEKEEVGGNVEWRDWKKIFVYLTPDGDLPYELKKDGSVEYNPAWCVFSYSTVLNIVGEILRSPRGMVGNKLRYILEDYIEMVNNKILKTNTELRALCKKIRREHKDALELLMSYTDNIGDAVALSSQYICAALGVDVVCGNSDTKFEFIPHFIRDFFGESMELGGNGYKALCRVTGQMGDVRVVLFLEKDSAEWSAKQSALASAFGINTACKGKYCTLCSFTLLSEEQRQDEFDAQAKASVESGLSEFVAYLKEKQSMLVLG